MTTDAKKFGFLPEGGEILLLAIALFVAVIGLMGLMYVLAPKG